MDIWLSYQKISKEQYVMVLCPDKVGSMKDNTSQKITLKASGVNLGNFRNESLDKGFTRNGNIIYIHRVRFYLSQKVS